MSIYQDDGGGGDFGYAESWSNSDMSSLSTKVVKYQGGRSWRDYNDLEILNGAKILGGSPDNPGHLRVSYNTGLHGEYLADLENWEDPSQKQGFCNGVRGHVKEATRVVKSKSGLTREQLSDRNKRLNEQEHEMILDAVGQVIPTQAVAPLMPTLATHDDPVVALQQQLAGTHKGLEEAIINLQIQINDLSVQKAKVEKQYNAIAAAAGAEEIVVPTKPEALTEQGTTERSKLTNLPEGL